MKGGAYVLWIALNVVALVALLLAAGGLLGCSGLGPTPTPAPWILEEWAIAQCYLVEEFPSVVHYNATAYRFVGHEPVTVTLGGITYTDVYRVSGLGYVWGHFSKPRTIHYSKAAKHAVRHEAGHALLFAMGHPTLARCFGHPGCEVGAKPECY
jgi:hypothetical protein